MSAAENVTYRERIRATGLDESQPVADAITGTHDAVLRLFESEERGRVLDLPAGEGALALRLREMGFDPVCGDLDPERFKLNDRPCEEVDMEQPLPFGSKQFDYVCCVEGLEHTRRPFDSIKEFARVLTDCGKLVISTPNILNLTSRLKMLVSGNLGFFSDLYNPPSADSWGAPGGHMQPFGYLQARYALAWAGMYPEEVTVSRVTKLNRVAHLPAVVGLRALWALTPREKKRKAQVQITNSPAFLAGRVMVIKATKGERPPEWQPEIIPPYDRVL